jgi:hypothetical protein
MSDNAVGILVFGAIMVSAIWGGVVLIKGWPKR